jgi:uncharacterized metal-binding protein
MRLLLDLCSEEKGNKKDLIVLVGVEMSIIKHFVAAAIVQVQRNKRRREVVRDSRN